MTYSPKYTLVLIKISKFHRIQITQNTFSFHTGIKLEIRNNKISREYWKTKEHPSK